MVTKGEWLPSRGKKSEWLPSRGYMMSRYKLEMFYLRKLDKVMTKGDVFTPIRSMWSFEVTLQVKNVVRPFAQNVWPPNI